MSEKEKAKLKDNILRALVNQQISDLLTISASLKQDIRLMRYLSEELASDKLVELSNSTKRGDMTTEYVLQLTNKGTYFFSFDGGYLRKYRSTVWSTRWTIVKTFAALLNAIAILVIGFYSVYLTNKTNRLEKENERLKIELQSKGK